VWLLIISSRVGLSNRRDGLVQVQTFSAGKAISVETNDAAKQIYHAPTKKKGGLAGPPEPVSAPHFKAA